MLFGLFGLLFCFLADLGNVNIFDKVNHSPKMPQFSLKKAGYLMTGAYERYHDGENNLMEWDWERAIGL